MIPKISKLSKTNENYKYGFRWSVRTKKYTFIVRTFSDALRHWKQEIKRLYF